MLSMRHTAAGEAVTELILEVFRLNGRLLNAGDALTRPVQQTSARWQVLGALDEEALTVAEIARRMGLARQSVQRTADLLESDGLVSFVDNPAHQRARLALPTPRGRAGLESLAARQVAWVNRLTAGLDARDLQHTVETLRQVRTALENSTPDAGRTTTRTSQHARRGPARPTTRRRK